MEMDFEERMRIWAGAEAITIGVSSSLVGGQNICKEAGGKKLPILMQRTILLILFSPF